MDDSIKQLNQSIGLIEQSGETNKNGLEHILQAEIKSRYVQNIIGISTGCANT